MSDDDTKTNAEVALDHAHQAINGGRELSIEIEAESGPAHQVLVARQGRALRQVVALSASAVVRALLELGQASEVYDLDEPAMIIEVDDEFVEYVARWLYDRDRAFPAGGWEVEGDEFRARACDVVREMLEKAPAGAGGGGGS